MQHEFALEGLRVAEFAWAIAGPLNGKYLGDNGATVVHVESHTNIDTLRLASPFAHNISGINRSGNFAMYNCSKYGISINLNKPTGRAIGWKLALWADVIIENYSPGVMHKWSLDYENVSKAKPEIIYLSTSNQGQTGPYSHVRGYGNQNSALAGFFELTGWPDREPILPYGTYSDFFSPRFATSAIMAALLQREKTGRGVYIDLAQFDVGLHLLAPPIMDFFTNGNNFKRDGNRLPFAAPHGVYRCKGNDSWIAIAVFTEEEWDSFCKAVNHPEWTADPRFSSLETRKQNEDELDRLVENWTGEHDAADVERLMQEAGVAAGLVETMSDLFKDPQLEYRNHFQRLNHPEMGEHACENPSFKLSKTPGRARWPAPCLGEHNEYVLGTLLELSDDEISDALSEGGITTDADLGELITGI